MAALAGTQSYVDTSRRFSGAGAWSDDGLSRTSLVPVLDSDLVRRLDVGQVAYVYRGGVTYLQIKRLTGRQAAIGRGSAGGLADVSADVSSGGLADGLAGEPGDVGRLAYVGAPGESPTMPLTVAGAMPFPGVAVLPDVSEVLDEAFGARRG